VSNLTANIQHPSDHANGDKEWRSHRSSSTRKWKKDDHRLPHTFIIALDRFVCSPGIEMTQDDFYYRTEICTLFITRM
jgi:hypothetical protein